MGFLPSSLCFLAVSAASAQTYWTVTNFRLLENSEKILFKRRNEFIGYMTWEYQMLMIAMHGNSIFCIQLEKNKKTKKTWKNAWQKWYCGVLLMSTFERALWRDIEVVITRRSWKPFVRKGAWVRIPLSPLTVLRSQRDEFLVQNWITILQKSKMWVNQCRSTQVVEGAPLERE